MADPESRDESAPPQSQSPGLKRKSSEESHPEREEKRQRTAEPNQGIDESELAKLLAEATQNATAFFHTHNSTNNEASITNGHAMNPEMDMRQKSLPFLKNSSNQLLTTLARGPYEETVKIITDPLSDIAQTYCTQKSLFDDSLKIYSRDLGFLSAADLGITDPEGISILGTANLVNYLCRVFGGEGQEFYELNDHFIEIFVPVNGELEEEAGALLLSLKTQIFIGAVSGVEPGAEEELEKVKGEALNDLFPDNVGVHILMRHPDSEITFTESKFLTQIEQRREYIQKELKDADSIAAYGEQHSWDDFLRSTSEYLSKKYPTTTAMSDTQRSDSGGREQQEQNGSLSYQEIIDEANKAAAVALQSVGNSHDGLPSSNDDAMRYPHFGSQQQYMQNGSHLQYVQNGHLGQHSLLQSAPTHVLYEQARQASVNKSAPHSRRPGLPSQRRPWTQEEENALMAGLDQVRGPHWSQILALYGPKGSISEILKDRNQVQLKDKARNLKLFFLKSNIEVPYYLRSVTGELRTRAPHSAASKKEGERVKGEDVEGQVHVMAASQHGGVIGQSANWSFQKPHQPLQHHSPYASQLSQYPHQPPPQPMEQSSSSPGTEILDPVGSRGEIKTEIQSPASNPQVQTQERAVQKAMQEMSAEERLAISLKAEINRHVATETEGRIFKTEGT